MSTTPEDNRPAVVVELTVRVPQTAHQYLYDALMDSGDVPFYPDRFTAITAYGHEPLSEWPGRGSLHWCRGAAEWLLLEAHERADGHDTLLALDEYADGNADQLGTLDPDYPAHGNYGHYLVWSSRPIGWTGR